MTSTKQVYIIPPISRENESVQFFMKWFAEACAQYGFPVFRRWHIPRLVRSVGFRLKCRFSLSHDEKVALLFPESFYSDYDIFPYGFFYEIIPVLWDVWPEYWPSLVKSLKRNRIKTLFVTSSQVAQFVKSNFPEINCFHLLEGINTDVYMKGEALSSEKRNIDILEFGRNMHPLHEILLSMNMKNFVYQKDNKVIFPDTKSFREALSRSKVSICLPQCDTNPQRAKGVETLTQRYWECMLSRTLIWGRSPKELIEFMGYDPVIPINWSDPKRQMSDILAHIADYQSLVDRNYSFALNNASWTSRMPYIYNCLKNSGYSLPSFECRSEDKNRS